jgi:putative membrane protein
MKRFALFTTAIGLTLLVSACGRFDCGFGEGWGPMMSFGYGGMFMGMLLIVILVAAAIYWFAREAKSKANIQLTGETPLDILKKRYAKGEITRDEFEKMKKDLEA